MGPSPTGDLRLWGRTEEIDALLRLEPDERYYFSPYASACVGLGEHEPAIAVDRQQLAASPRSSDLHVSLGHSLKSVGRQKEATESYQMAASARPSFGDAWWSLANLKIYRFSQNEIAQMRAEEAASTTQTVDRYNLCFALGKAFEDRRIMAMLPARQRTQPRRKPISSGHHRNEHAQADRGVH